MASYNRIVLMGNLTRDVQLRYLQNGTAVTDIGMAVNDRVKKGDEWVDDPCFVDVTLFGKTAEVAGQYLSKGSTILIEGRLKLESWVDKEGQKRSKHKVVADKMQMVGAKNGNGGGNSAPTQQASAAPEEEYSQVAGDDEIPF